MDSPGLMACREKSARMRNGLSAGGDPRAEVSRRGEELISPSLVGRWGKQLVIDDCPLLLDRCILPAIILIEIAL